VVVRLRDGQTGILLVRADRKRQESAVGDQFAGRVGMFLRVDDFEERYQRLVRAAVEVAAALDLGSGGDTRRKGDGRSTRWVGRRPE
jgi:hypothetical protein